MITAITTANGNGVADTITLTANITLTAVDNSTYGPTGLPVISSEITIVGNGRTLSRAGAAPEFRLLTIASSGDLTIQDTTLSGGKMPDASALLNDGGGIANYSGQLRLEGCTVSGNTADGDGGGIYSNTDGSDEVVIINSTLSGNSAGDVGGGVSILALDDTSSLTINNSTISGNSADDVGGGVYSFTFGSSIVTLRRTLIAGNTATNGGDEIRRFNAGGSSFTAANFNLFGHSDIDNSQAFSGFTPGATDITATSDGNDPTALTDILDTTLANNFGPTDTHNLVEDSPAIDASPDDGDCEPTDQRGIPRPQGPACDIGAVEFFVIPPTPTFAEACGTTTPTSGCTVNGQKNQLCIGTAGKDTITGTTGDDVILGLGSDDTLKGGEGHDCIDGGLGNDKIEGQDGDDVLFGGGGKDNVRGGRGEDLIVTGSGNDTVQGDEGDDTLFDSGGTNSLKGRSGEDEIYAPGTSGTIDGGFDVDLCVGGTTQVDCP